MEQIYKDMLEHIQLESLSTSLRKEALSDGKTISDILNDLPTMRQQVCIELYGKEQVAIWENKWKNISLQIC